MKDIKTKNELIQYLKDNKASKCCIDATLSAPFQKIFIAKEWVCPKCSKTIYERPKWDAGRPKDSLDLESNYSWMYQCDCLLCFKDFYIAEDFSYISYIIDSDKGEEIIIFRNPEEKNYEIKYINENDNIDTPLQKIKNNNDLDILLNSLADDEADFKIEGKKIVFTGGRKWLLL